MDFFSLRPKTYFYILIAFSAFYVDPLLGLIICGFLVKSPALNKLQVIGVLLMLVPILFFVASNQPTLHGAILLSALGPLVITACLVLGTCLVKVSFVKRVSSGTTYRPWTNEEIMEEEEDDDDDDDDFFNYGATGGYAGNPFTATNRHF